MTIKKFSKLILNVLGVLAAINIIFNAGFDYLQKTDRIISQTVDGFTTWRIVLEPVKKEKINYVHPSFIAETQEFKDLEKHNSVIILLGSSVVEGAALKVNERFSSLLTEKFRRQDMYFFNAGISGAEVYTEFEKLQPVLERLNNVKCVVWFPTINDYVTKEVVMGRQELKDEAQSLKDDSKMKWRDRIFFGFYKRLAQKMGFEQNIIKENSMDSPHQLYYTNGLKQRLNPDILNSLRTALGEGKSLLEKKSIQMAAVLLPSRHFNRYYNWKDAHSFQQLTDVLSDLRITHSQYFSVFKGIDPFVDYIHFGEQGHRIIADNLQKDILRLCKL